MSHPSNRPLPRPAQPRRAVRPLAALAAAALLASATGSAHAGGGHLHQRGPIVEIPVSFEIRNDNVHPPPTCLPDRGSYTLRGHIVGPRGALRSSHPKTISVLLGGFDSSSEWLWRGFAELPGYDTAFELAELGGHITLSLDPLGYGESGRPVPGSGVCFGSQAEVLHQVVTQLRVAGYASCGLDPIGFSRVNLVGHDIGGAMVSMYGYLYRDVDGLVDILWADQGFTPFITTLAGQRAAQCAAGGDGSGQDTGDGYVLFGPEPDSEFRDQLFFDADEQVEDAVIARRERNPCGYVFPVLPNRQTDESRYAEIELPVLLMFPVEDPVFSRDGQDQQADHFSSSERVTTIFLEDTAHFPMFERNAACFRELLSAWLTDPEALEQELGGPVASACARVP